MAQRLVIITTNKSHPAFEVSEDNLHIILQDELSALGALELLECIPLESSYVRLRYKVVG